MWLFGGWSYSSFAGQIQSGAADSIIDSVSSINSRKEDFIFTYPPIRFNYLHLQHVESPYAEYRNSFDVGHAVPVQVWVMLISTWLITGVFSAFAVWLLGKDIGAERLTQTLQFNFGKLTGSGPKELQQVRLEVGNS